MKQCAQCEQATIELALIKSEIVAWQDLEREGLGELSAGPRIRRIAKRFEGFELLEHPARDNLPARIELSFPPERFSMRAGGAPGDPRAPTSPERRGSMRTLFEFRSRSWLRWVVVPLAWALSVLVAWWVIH